MYMDGFIIFSMIISIFSISIYISEKCIFGYIDEDGKLDEVIYKKNKEKYYRCLFCNLKLKADEFFLVYFHFLYFGIYLFIFIFIFFFN
jgi:hypothetical protein